MGKQPGHLSEIYAMTIEEIRDTSSLVALAREWSGLWERCPSATPFQSPEWLLPWWKHFGHDGLMTLAVRQRGRLAGIAPLFLFQHPGCGFRQVSLLGSGITDYLDFLMEPEAAEEVTSAVFAYLLSQKSRWDICDFQELRAVSPLLSFPALSGLHLQRTAMQTCPVLVLPETVAAFRAGLTARSRKRLRYTENNIERAGGACTATATGATRLDFLEALFRLHRAAWEERKESGVLADPRVQAFHREVSAGFLERGWLRLRVLSIAGSISAALYSFAVRGRLYCYLSGFDPGAAPYSPGKFILWRAIEDSIAEGVREFDFLRGDEEYKYAWGPQNRINYRLSVWHVPSFHPRGLS
ncbi:MAG: GNAT family N-acetyltransferase [Nitrospirales bacterium]|nr:GNAT family N-acetyltransferase [Nitrospirales bacterium]